MNSNSSGNNRATHICFERSRDCAVYTFVLTFSTFIFVTSMILTAYLTHIANMDTAVVVLIVDSCLLYLSGFTGNMYSVYYSKPNSRPSENGENSNRLCQITGVSAQSTSTNVRAPDILSFSRAREHFRRTPSPPYEVQMSEMSRTVLPGTSRTTESSAREAEIAEEARKLVQMMYEEIKRTDQLAPQPSTDEQSVQQMVQTPETAVRQQETMSPKVSHQNMVVQKQQTVVKSSPGRGLPPVGFRTNQVIQQKVAQSSLPTQLDLGRLIIGSEGCSAVPQQLTPGILDRPPVDFRTNRVIEQKVKPNSPQTQPDLEKFIIGSGGYTAASPQLSPRIPGHPSVDFRPNQVIQQKMTPNSLPTQLNLGRLIIGSDECGAVPQQLSPYIPDRPPVDFRTNQVIQQNVTPNSRPPQPDLEKFIIGSEGYTAASPQLSHRREDFLKAAYKRKLTCLSQELQTRPKTTGNVPHETAVDSGSQNNEYEEIEVVENIQRANSSQMVYDSVECYGTEREFEDSSEQSSSVTSAVSEPAPAKWKRKFGTPSVKERRQLSALSTRKFYQLGQSPDTVLDAIATCFDVTPNEWMVAWKLSLKGVPPIERARILGVRLQEDSYNDDN